MPTEKKSLLKQIANGAWTAVVASTIGLALLAGGTVGYANVVQNNALSECEDAYDSLLVNGLINDTTTPETVKDNCKTLKPRIEALLKQYGGEGTVVFVTGNLNTFCGEETTGCVQKLKIGGKDNFPVMSISYTADYYIGLEETVAHEYVHIMTSDDETERLRANPDFWADVRIDENGAPFTVKNDPAEAVADCGLSYFTGKPFTGGAYMASCTPEQTEAAYAVIEDRY